MSLVLDPSVVAGWFIGDESSSSASAALSVVAASGALVPSPWPSEVTTMFLLAERRGRITTEDVSLALESLAARPIEVRPTSTTLDPAALPRITRDCRPKAYDASSLEVALSKPVAPRNAGSRLAAGG